MSTRFSFHVDINCCLTLTQQTSDHTINTDLIDHSVSLSPYHSSDWLITNSRHSIDLHQPISCALVHRHKNMYSVWLPYLSNLLQIWNAIIFQEYHLEAIMKALVSKSRSNYLCLKDMNQSASGSFLFCAEHRSQRSG